MSRLHEPSDRSGFYRSKSSTEKRDDMLKDVNLKWKEIQERMKCRIVKNETSCKFLIMSYVSSRLRQPPPYCRQGDHKGVSR